MTWVKICGMTNLEDALVAVEAGADAVGFVFCERSPRNVGVEEAREIVEQLPNGVEKVGVFVHETADTIRDASKKAGLTLAQAYPDLRNPLANVTDEFLERAVCRVIVALQASQLLQAERDDSDVISGFRVSSRFRDKIAGMLLDSGGPDRPGGTGQKFNWERMAPITEMTGRIGVRLILAGGLTPGNVGDGMKTLKPWGVDVASGVEARPGKKDPEKVRAFVRAVREIDREPS